MASIEQQYPEIKEYLDNTDDYENFGSEFELGDNRYLLVTQKGIDGQQLLFKWNGTKFEYWDNETIIDYGSSIIGFPARRERLDATFATCGPSSGADHDSVYQYWLAARRRFATRRPWAATIGLPRRDRRWRALPERSADRRNSERRPQRPIARQRADSKTKTSASANALGQLG